MTRAKTENLKYTDKMKYIRIIRTMALAAFLAIPFTASAQKYQGGIVDKTIAAEMR